MGRTQIIQPHVDARAAIQDVLDKERQQEGQIQQLTKLNDQLRHQIAEQTALLKQLAVFQPLLADTTKTMRVYIRNKALIGQAKARLLQAFGPAGKMDTGGGKGLPMGNILFDRLVEECLAYGVMLKWHEILPRLEFIDAEKS